MQLSHQSDENLISQKESGVSIAHDKSLTRNQTHIQKYYKLMKTINANGSSMQHMSTPLNNSRRTCMITVFIIFNPPLRQKTNNNTESDRRQTFVFFSVGDQGTPILKDQTMIRSDCGLWSYRKNRKKICSFFQKRKIKEKENCVPISFHKIICSQQEKETLFTRSSSIQYPV